MSDCPNEGEKAVGFICVCERDVVIQEALKGVCAGDDSFVEEGWTTGGDFVVSVVGIVCIAIITPVSGFVGGVRMRERELVLRWLDDDVRSPLGGGRMILGAVVLCAEGLVRVGTFGTGCVGCLGTDGGLDTGEFMAEGCFGVGEDRGRGVQNLVAGEL